MSLFGLEKPSLPGAQGHCTTDVTKGLRLSKKRIWKAAASFACMAPSSLKKWGIDWPLLRVSLFLFEIVNASFFKGYFKDQQENNAIEWTHGWARKNLLLRLLYRFLGEGRPRKLTKLMKLFFSFSCNNSHNSVMTAMYWVAHTSQGSWQYHTCTAVFGNMSAQYRHKNCMAKKKSWCFRRVFLFIFLVLVFS